MTGIRRNAAWIAIGLLLAAALLILPVLVIKNFLGAIQNLGGGPGLELVVENASANTLIFEVADYHGTRYYAVPPNTPTLIDTEGEANPPPDSVREFGSDCVLVGPISGLANEGTITSAADGSANVVPDRPPSSLSAHWPGDQWTGYATCQDAARQQ
jgi:hypothetical protein